MKSIKRYVGLVGAILIVGAMWSCKDETVNTPDPEDSEKVAVQFLIPSSGPSFGYSNTRATDEELESGYLGSGEGAISNLYIVSVQLSYFNYKADGTYVEQRMDAESNSGRQRVVVTPINVYDHTGEINGKKTYPLSLYPGRYRFYVFANCDLYVDNFYNSSGIYKEEDVKKIALFYESDVPMKLAHLPMSCTPDRIKYDGKDGTNLDVEKSDNDWLNYTVPIYKNTKANIYVNLKFMCSKVRYTILFDDTPAYQDENGNWKEGISSGFGNQSIRFYVDEMGENRPVATYLRKRTFLYPGLDVDGRLEADKNDPFILNTSVVSEIESESYFNKTREGETDGMVSFANWPAPLNRYEWPAEGENYPIRPMDVLDPFTGTLDEWKASRKRAWQGVVYLPENQTADITKTELHFPYVIDRYAENVGTEDEIPYKDGEITGAYKILKLFGNSSETQYGGGSSYKDQYGEELGKEDYSSGLERGYFYDVVARVITPDKWDLKIIVYGVVEQWHDIEQSVTEGEDPNPGGSRPELPDPAEIGVGQDDWNYNSDKNQW